MITINNEYGEVTTNDIDVILFNAETSPEITVKYIKMCVCTFYKVDYYLLKENTRKREVVKCRHIAMYLSRFLTSSKNYEYIANEIAGQGHSSVNHAVGTINDLVRGDKKLLEEIKEIERKYFKKAKNKSILN